MKTRRMLLALALSTVSAITALGQGQGQPADPERTPGVQGPADPNRAAFLMKNCKNPTVQVGRGGGAAPAAPGAPAAPAPGGAGAAGGGGRAGGGAPPTPPVFQDVASTEIPGVIAAGQHWKVIWEDKGNNADGIVAFDDGSVWLAQNDK